MAWSQAKHCIYVVSSGNKAYFLGIFAGEMKAEEEYGRGNKCLFSNLSLDFLFKCIPAQFNLQNCMYKTPKKHLEQTMNKQKL